MPTVKVSARIPKKLHKTMLGLADEANSTIGAIVAYAIRSTVESLLDSPTALKKLPKDGRRKENHRCN